MMNIKSVLSFLIALLLCASLIACGDASDPAPSEGDNTPKNEETVKLVIPESEDFGRGTVHYSELEYSYPDTERLLDGLRSVTEAIKAGEQSFEALIGMIRELEEDYTHFLTSYSYLTVENAKDSASELYSSDYARIREEYPLVSDLVEEMSVAAAASDHAERFEQEYFGEGFIEKYGDGERYTDAVTALLTKEAQLEAEFSGLSTESVEITYEGKTATAAELIDRYAKKYGDASSKYKKAKEDCERLYSIEVQARTDGLLVELIKVRRLIADELGYESYTEYAYELQGHDYSPESAFKLTADIASYAVPVYQKLYHTVLNNYYAKHEAPKIYTSKMINSLGEIYGAIDGDYGDIFNYMLHFGLFDVEREKTNRESGAFTTYLVGNASPFVFMSAEGLIGDYMTLAHEFGHFRDMFINGEESRSLDLEETASQGLELLTLKALEGRIGESEHKYLYYSEMENMLLMLIFQSFYARFEHYAYALPYEEITKERLTELVIRSAGEMKLNPEYYCELSSVTIPHLLLYPLYVQSYLTSGIVALEIFFAECDKEGAGFTAYDALLAVGDADFESRLFSAELGSPFDERSIKLVIDRVYFSITGSHYYKDNSSDEECSV